MTVSLGQAWRAIRDRFASAAIETAALDARLIVRHVLDLDETALIAREPEPFPEDKTPDLEALVTRRLAGEPVARLFGVQEFYGLPFALNDATLIPRPETEMLVDFGIVHLKNHETPSILDLGTGTGCIVLSLLFHLPNARGVGVDLSAHALDSARANGETLGVVERFSPREGSWFEPLNQDERFDLIVSNPPYIASAAIAELAPGVRDFDPALALDGGQDGLDPYRIIAREAGRFLAPGGALALEIGFDQGQSVAALLHDGGWSAISVGKDLSGHDRMVTARMPAA